MTCTNSTSSTKPADLKAIASKLAEVNFILLSIHNQADRLVYDAITPQDIADVSNAIQCMAKTTSRSLDACIKRLGHGEDGLTTGHFEEFDAEQNEEASHA